MRIKLLTSLFLTIGFLSTNLTFAASAPLSTTSNLQTNATLNSSCEFNATPINFGTINSGDSSVQTTSTVNVICSKSVSFAIAFDTGLYGTLGLPSSRKMRGVISNNQDYITYNLRKGSHTGTLLNNVGPGRLLGSGTGIYQEITIYAELYSTYVTPDSYSDTTTMTITY